MGGDSARAVSFLEHGYDWAIEHGRTYMRAVVRRMAARGGKAAYRDERAAGCVAIAVRERGAYEQRPCEHVRGVAANRLRMAQQARKQLAMDAV